MQLPDKFTITTSLNKVGTFLRIDENTFAACWNDKFGSVVWPVEEIVWNITQNHWMLKKEENMNETKQLPKQFKFKHYSDNGTIYTAALVAYGEDYTVTWENGFAIYPKSYAEKHVKEKDWIILEEQPAQPSLQQLKKFCKDVGVEVAITQDGFEIYYWNDKPLSVKSEQDLLSAMEAIKTLENIRGKG